MARDLRLFYLFRLLSTSYLWVPISQVFAASRGLSLVAYMLLNTVYSAVVILTEVPTGALADRLGRRATMMAGAVAMVAACLTFAAAEGFVGFAVATGLAALSMTLCSGADSAYLFDLLNDFGRGHEYPHREGTASAWHQAGQALAFLAGGLLAGRSLVLPYLVTAGVASVAFFVALFMREGPRPQGANLLAPREYVAHARGAFQLVRSRGALVWAIGYSSVVFVLLRATEHVYQPYLRASGWSVAETGVIYAAVYLVAAAVAHNFGALRRWLAESTLIWMLLGTLIVTFLILGNIAGPLALVVMGIQNAANGLYSPLSKLLIQREIPDSERRATVLSVESMTRRLAYGLFAPAIGFLMDRYGPSAGLTVCGLFGLAGLALLAPSLRGSGASALAPRAPAVSPAPAPVVAPERD
jgi:MFS family permease